MRVALVNTYDLEGGAARAALRLHLALSGAGVESALFVQQRSGADSGVHGPTGNWPRVVGRLRWQVDHLPGLAVGARRGEYSVNWLGSGLAARLAAFAPDVVHLHWINAGFVSLGEVAALRVPVFWTAHDMWPFTGGCHYDRGCGHFAERRCAPCPLQIGAPTMPLARRRLATKVALRPSHPIDYIAPSRWMAAVGHRSPVTAGRPVSVIPNAIDVDRFKPIDRAAARALFGLPADRTVLLFGGVLSNTDPRKGFQLLDAALRTLAGTPWADQVSLCVFGSAERSEGQVHGIPVRYVGHLHDDESLVGLYSACDVFMAPSLQDNLPNTVMEAAACGIPTVAFNVGGMPDLIEHAVSGWLAEAGDAASLAAGIVHAARDAVWRRSAGAAARRHAEATYASSTVAEAHLALYRRRVGHPADAAAPLGVRAG